MAYLQFYQELLSNFLRLYSNPKEVSYLSWKNKYPDKISILIENLLQISDFQDFNST